MKIRKFLTQLVLVLSITSLFLLIQGVSQDVSYAQSSIQDPIKSIQEATNLPTFDDPHVEASQKAGASNFTSAIRYVIDFLKFLVGGVAVLVIVIAGIKLVMARKKIDEVWPKQKEHLIMITVGIIFIFVADAVVDVFFGVEGEVFTSEELAISAAQRGSEEIRGIYDIGLFLIATLAVFMLIVAGIRLLVAAGNEEVQTKVKKQITWLTLGLFLVGVAEFVVLDFIFPEQGTQLPATNVGITLIVDFTNFISGFITFAAIISLIYGGYLYVSAVGNDERLGKAKKTIIGSVIAIIIAMGAFAIVNTLVPLQITSP